MHQLCGCKFVKHIFLKDFVDIFFLIENAYLLADSAYPAMNNLKVQYKNYGYLTED